LDLGIIYFYKYRAISKRAEDVYLD